MPQALLNKPELNSVWSWPYSVWSQLSGGRSTGMDSSSDILVSEVTMYGMLYDCSRLEIADLWESVHAIDTIWRSEVSKVKDAKSSK